jgi:hypothetical protein
MSSSSLIKHWTLQLAYKCTSSQIRIATLQTVTINCLYLGQWENIASAYLPCTGSAAGLRPPGCTFCNHGPIPKKWFDEKSFFDCIGASYY